MITDNDPDSGKIKKARAQVATLNDSGVTAQLIIVTQTFPKEEKFDDIQVFNVEKPRSENFFSKITRAKQIRSIIAGILTVSDTHDIFYYRGQFRLWYYPLIFFRPFRKCIIISEHNSIEIKQSLLSHSYFAAFIDLLSGNVIIGQSDGIIGVTDEITRYWSRRLFYRNIPSTTIPNGFDTKSVEVRNLPPFDPHTIHILFVGNVSRWHGLDRMLRGIADYHGPFHIHFHIVGDGDEVENLKQIHNSMTTTADIHFHGFLRGPDLDKMFDRCHIAIGSLGLHRNRMKQASSLKVREYCSRGIPFILSNKDPDFSDNFDYCLQVDPADTPVRVEEIISFTHKVYENTHHPKIMRRYAEEHVDWHVKMIKLKEFINTFQAS